MKTKISVILSSLTLKRKIFHVLIAITLSPIIFYTVKNTIINTVNNSITLSGLWNEVIQLIGPYKYMDIIITFGPILSILLIFIIFTINIIILYLYERRRHYKKSLEQIIHEFAYIADGHFDYQITHKDYPDLSILAENTNQIVQKLKKSIEEERLAEQAKNELITNVSHDLRTPLTSLVGFLGLIDQDQYKDETELRYYIQVSYEKAKRLNKLIDDLFEYTRVHNRGLRLNKGPVNMTEMLSQLVVEFHPLLLKALLQCKTTFEQKNLVVFADGDKLARVFENLIMNAMKYGADGKFIDIFAREENNQIVIEIVNYGSPIPSMDLPFIFERFYQVEKSRTEKVSGTGSGLGLAIAKGIVELHDGTVHVQSNQEKTIFTVILPKWEN